MLIWNSTLLMSIIDIGILVAVLYLLAILHRQRRHIDRLGLRRGIRLIWLGLAVTAAFLCTELVVMLMLPRVTSSQEAMRLITEIHLGWSWFALVVVVACEAGGLGLLLRGLVPSAARSMEDLDRQVSRRTTARSRS